MNLLISIHIIECKGEKIREGKKLNFNRLRKTTFKLMVKGGRWIPKIKKKDNVTYVL